MVPVCCPSPEPGTHWGTIIVQPSFCIGRYEGTDKFLGRREAKLRLFARTIVMVREPQEVFGAATSWPRQYPEIKSGHATDCRLPRLWNAEKKVQNPLLGVVCLLTSRVLIRVGRPLGMKACFQPLGVILPAKDWATILPSRTTNVSVPTSYTLSAVSAVHRM